MVQQLVSVLPAGFVAEPRVNLGDFYEIDVCGYEDYSEDEPVINGHGIDNGRVSASVLAAPAPSLTLEAEFAEQYAYEVLIFDMERERQLVAAIEIVSPSNKDRPEHRQLFIAKCFNLLKEGVCVSIVDLVTIKKFNLYAELLTLLRGRDPAYGPTPPPTYAATCRKNVVGDKTTLDTWSFALTVGQPLPQIPIWLAPELHVMLDLESSYEETCRALRIP